MKIENLFDMTVEREDLMTVRKELLPSKFVTGHTDQYHFFQNLMSRDS